MFEPVLDYLLEQLVSGEVDARSCLIDKHNFFWVQQGSRDVYQLLLPSAEVVAALLNQRIKSLSRLETLPNSTSVEDFFNVLVFQLM